MNRLATALLSFAVGMLVMHTIWLQRLVSSGVVTPQVQQDVRPPARAHLTAL